MKVHPTIERLDHPDFTQEVAPNESQSGPKLLTPWISEVCQGFTASSGHMNIS